jgi:hypothetical protein
VIAAHHTTVSPGGRGVVFSAAPNGVARDRFVGGEPIYAKVALDAAHATLGAQVEVRVDDFPCARAPIPSAEFAVDLVRPSNPSTVRAPDVPYDAQCLELYEQAVLAGRGFTVAVKVRSANGDVIAYDVAKVSRAPEPREAIAALHRSFEASHVLPNGAPFTRDAAALVAARTFTEETNKTQAVPLAVALHGTIGYVAMRRPNGTCFVQPSVTFAWHTKLDGSKDFAKLHESGVVDDEVLAKAQRTYEAAGGHAERVFEITHWPGAYDPSVWPREPKPYDLPCSNAE